MMKVLLLSLVALAVREQGAHVHGSGKVSMAFDGKKGKIEMHLPGESVIGFEHEARSKKDKQKKEQALQKLEEKISEMIVFDPSLKCVIRKDIFEVSQQSAHSDIIAEFSVDCETPVKDSVLTFNFRKHFPRLRKVQVDVLTEGVQKSVQANANGDTLELK